MFRHARSALLAALLLDYSVAIPIGPFLTVNNAARESLSIAPGSFVQIFSKSTLSAGLGGIRITLAAGDRTYTLPAVEPPFKSPNYVWAVIPFDAPLGEDRVTLGDFSEAIRIVATAPGIFTRDYAGEGPAIAVDKQWQPIALTSAAVPEQEISFYATGLGGASTNDVKVELAGKSVAPLYAGPEGMPGLDQINFIVPKDAYLGCYVPIAIRVRGILSNYGTLSINSDSAACAHPLGLSYAELKKLDDGGNISFGVFRAGEAHNNRDGAVALWLLEADSGGVSGVMGMQMPDSLYFSCSSPEVAGWGNAGAGSFDAGDAMTFSGPGGSQYSMGKNIGGPYMVKDALQVLLSGTWQISAPGGQDIQAFSLPVWLPPSSRDIDISSTGEDVTVTWDPSGFLPSDVVTVWNDRFPPKQATCRARAGDGRIVFPRSLLRTEGQFSLVVSPYPAARPSVKLDTKSGGSIPLVAGYEFVLASGTVE